MRRLKLAILAGSIAVISVIGAAAPASASEGPCDNEVERLVCVLLQITCLPDCLPDPDPGR